MRDLVNQVNNPLTRAYGVFTNNNKMAFWYQLAEGMTTGEIFPLPDNYKLTFSSALRQENSLQNLEILSSSSYLKNLLETNLTHPCSQIPLSD